MTLTPWHKEVDENVAKGGIFAQRELAKAFDFLAHVLAGPVVAPMPVLTPEVWKSMRCREGGKCDCDFCRWEARYGKVVAGWNLAQQLRPRERKFLPTLDHVLVAWAEQTEYRSAAGAMMQRAHDEASSPERSRTPWHIRRADVAVEVEQSVIWAFRSDEARCGYRTAICVLTLKNAVRGAAIEDETASRVVRLGRRGTMIDLAAREVIREPRAARDRIAVADRLNEIRVANSERVRAPRRTR